MEAIAEAIERLFESQGWRYIKNDNTSYRFGFRSRGNRFDLLALIAEQPRTLSIYTKIPIQASAERMGAVAEYVARANWDMILGNFEIDVRDGEIRYKNSISFQHRDPTGEEISDLIDCSLAMADRYYPGFGAVIYGRKSADVAIQIVEVV